METGVEFILIQLFVLYALAKGLGELFERLKQPAVVGEIIAGIIIGPSGILLANYLFGAEIASSLESLHLYEGEVLSTLAELGVIVLLFTVGLETKFSDLKKVGFLATLVAVLGVVVPFGLGAAYILLTTGHNVEALFIGAAMVATSVGITARVLTDLDVIYSVESRIILGAAVIDDVLGMIVLTLVIGISAPGGGISILHIAQVIIIALLFVFIMMLMGGKVVRKSEKYLEKMKFKDAPLAAALMVCFGLSAVAMHIGLAAIIGAFLAGMAFAEINEKYHLGLKMSPINTFLVPFFFVLTGTRVDISTFGTVAVTATIITVLAILGKLVGCGLASIKLGKESAFIIGSGMVPRGEVGIIVAVIGYTAGAISSELYSVVVIMAMVTTLVAPPMLKWGFKHKDTIRAEKWKEWKEEEKQEKTHEEKKKLKEEPKSENIELKEHK